MGAIRLANLGLVGVGLLTLMCESGSDGGDGAANAGAGEHVYAAAGVGAAPDDMDAGGHGGVGGPGGVGGYAGGDLGGADGDGGSVGGYGGSHEGGGPDCDTREVVLRAVRDVAAEALHELAYDELNRLSYERSGSQDAYDYHYDSAGRLAWVLGVDNEGRGFYVSYPSPNVVRYTDDDYPSHYEIAYESGRWLAWDLIPDVGTRAYKKTPVWEQGLLTQITHLERQYVAGEAPIDTSYVESFTYDVDADGNPVRMLSSLVEPSWRTREVYDEQGRHLFQLVETALGEPAQVRLFRDNQNPVHSLFEPANPGDELASGPNAFASNEWLRLSFDPEVASGPLQGLAPHGWVRPLDLAPWHPLAFEPDEMADFASDIDGDEIVDVRGDFSFDDEGRFTDFVLELEGAERVVLHVAYTPSLVTETASYPGSERPDDVREYYYDCPDVELPDDWSQAGAPAR